jgi:TrmH family RNA methyltransferase
MSLDRIRVVLVRPRNAGNVGATARAMKNMGLRRLVLVAPRGDDGARAREMAVHAEDVLGEARRVGTLKEAVADCGLVVGATSRQTARSEGECSPRAAAAMIVTATAANDVAVVFGPENHGLSGDELALCHRVLSIPASEAYASLNLAQAVLVVAYEIFLAAGAHAPRATRARAATGQIELMYEKLEESLRAIGFLRRDNAEHMMRTMRDILGRAALDEREVRVCLGLARQILWAGTRRPRVGGPAAVTGQAAAAAGTPT